MPGIAVRLDCIINLRSAATPIARLYIRCFADSPAPHLKISVSRYDCDRQITQGDEYKMEHLLALFILSIVIPSGFQTCVATNVPYNSTLPTELFNSTSIFNNSFISETSDSFTSCSASVVSWLGFEKPVPDDFINNCRLADQLLQAAIYRHGSQRFEFVPRWWKGRPDLQVMRTPIKYTAGTLFPQSHSVSRKLIKVVGTTFACTITVANMVVVPQRYVGHAPRHVTDVATFHDVGIALSDIWRRCLYGPPERQVGYAVTGLGSSLGVFVYGVHASIAFGMPMTLDSITPPGSTTGDGEQVDLLDVL